MSRPVSPNTLLPVLTAEAMRAADQFTIETFGLPGLTLMETAGRGAAACIATRFGPLRNRRVVIFCGKGNNGGDGLVVARVLFEHGTRLDVVTLAEEDEMSADAAHNLRLLRRLEANDPAGRLRLFRWREASDFARFEGADLYVDALLGTGQTSAPRPPLDDIVRRLNTLPAPRVALDLPTGLHSDTGVVPGEAVRATMTVTMGALKTGLLLGEGPAYAGHVEVVEIGIPSFVLERVRKAPGCALLATDEAVRSRLPVRPHDAHKYSVGLALVVGGSPDFTGAPVMAAEAAARVGSGFVVCACPASVRPAVAAHLTEVTTLALPDDADGLTPAGHDVLAERLAKARALLVGPGLGRRPGTGAFVRTLLQETRLPAVIDADGLFALAGHTEWLARRAGGRWLLTPHAGEFKRLAGDDADLTDRIRTAQTYAERWNVVLLLKGAPSVVACPDGTAYVAPTHPALATAGSGDVLAGLCVGLIAQGLPPAEAAVAALHLGRAAAEHYTARHDARSMVASDLLRVLPSVLHERFSP
ncbi:MAG: bifunctional NAD(P)H-hydrate repair enzyme Nnr [Rhodothermaceae bacterium]|nr:MAG: bifunctional NAD(P)H-hydrate repair enzyme Nnr [Rhodothermaceae bacterium]